MKNLLLIFCFFFLLAAAYAQVDYLNYDEHGISPKLEHKISTLGTNASQDYGNEWTSIGPYGGDVFDLAIDPTNTDRVYAASGYPYMRNSPDEPWQIIESLLSLSPSGIHVFEINSEGTIFAAGNYYYYGIFQSTDNGITWTQLSLPITAGVLNITIDPSNEDIMYVVTTSNISWSQNKVIIKSEDQGSSWSAQDMTSILPPGWPCNDLAVDPDNSQTLFALGDGGISDAKAIASFDGGSTWQNVSSGLPEFKPFNEVTIVDGIVYISGGQLFGGNIMGIYKSENYGTSWEDISVGFPVKVVNDILVHPNDNYKIWAATEGGGIYYTLNGGLTWNYNTNGAGDNGSARKIAFVPGNNNGIYAGFLSLGVCMSENGGYDWISSTVGIAALKLNNIEIDPGNPDIILASFEAENSGGCYLYDPIEGDWAIVGGLPATRFSAVSIATNGTMYAWSNGPTTIAAEGLYKSTDGGTNWENMGPNIGIVFETQIFALDVSETDPDLIFIAGNNFGANGWASMIYRSVDGGANWENVFMGPDNDGFKYIFIDPGSNDQVVYAAYKTEGTGAGFIKSIDGGTSWGLINTGIPPATKWGSAIICDPDNPDIVYGGAGGYGGTTATVYKSENGGSSWNTLNISLSNYSKITDLLISPLNPDVIYASTSLDGVYLTEDGENWSPAVEGLPATNVTGFSRLFEQDEELGFYAATFTNSAFYTQLYEPGAIGIHDNSYQENVNIFPVPSQGCIGIDAGALIYEQINITIFNTLGKQMDQFIKTYSDGSVIQLDLELETGIYLVIIETENKKYTRKIVIN